MTDALLTGLIFEQNRYFVAFLNNMLACYFLMVVTSPYKTAYLPECKHSQNAVLHGSESLQFLDTNVNSGLIILQ